MKPAAFLFDLDGTLIDSERPWARAMVAWLAARGQATTVERIAPLVSGRSWRDIHAALHRAFPGMGASTIERDVGELRPHFDRLVADPSVLVVPGAVAFVRRAARHAPCAVVSGSPQADVEQMVAVCGLDGEVAFALGGEAYGRGKPAPDGYLLAARRLGVPPAACVVVEDSVHGVRAGVAAGMRVLGVKGRQLVPHELEGCDWTVDDLSRFDWRHFEV
ncbi:MAG: HAD family hydrolase [Kiritimatiellia bacterium]